MSSSAEQPNRADLAEALARAAEASPSLADALAINEAWAMGYVAELLVNAEVLAAQASDDLFQPLHIDADTAIAHALTNANPRMVFDRWHEPIPPGVTAALHTMLAAQATFHRAAVVLERRGLRREPPRL